MKAVGLWAPKAQLIEPRRRRGKGIFLSEQVSGCEVAWLIHDM